MGSEDDLFATLDEVPVHVNGLWWGAEGSTKTTSIASAANFGQMMMVSSEGGLIKATLQRRGVKTENLRIYPRPGEDVTIEGLQAVYKRLATDLDRDPTSWFAVGVDSATDITEKLLEASSDERMAKLAKRNVASDPWFTDISDYGTVGKKMRWFLRRLRDLPCHTLITALSKRDVDEDTGEVTYGPAANEGVQRLLLSYPDLSLACKAPDETRPARALTKEGGRYRCKDRFDLLPKTMVEPTFDRVWRYLQGDLLESTDPLQKLAPKSGKKAKKEGEE